MVHYVVVGKKMVGLLRPPFPSSLWVSIPKCSFTEIGTILGDASSSTPVSTSSQTLTISAAQVQLRSLLRR